MLPHQCALDPANLFGCVSGIEQKHDVHILKIHGHGVVKVMIGFEFGFWGEETFVFSPNVTAIVLIKIK